MNTFVFIKQLESYNRSYFTTADLEKVTGLSRASLKVKLNRLVDRGVLTRLKRGVYVLGGTEIRIEKVANQLYYPSYLSFESALSDYGVLSQVPYTKTFATVKPSKRIKLLNTLVEYRQIKPDLFFGYRLENGVYVAEVAKALLDTLYMSARGKGGLNLEELDLRSVNKKTFKQYASKFPSYLRKNIKDVLSYLGTSAITLETRERI